MIERSQRVHTLAVAVGEFFAARRLGAAEPTRAYGPPASRRRGPLRAVAALLLVPALVGTLALPAYAFLPGGHLPGVQTKFSLSIAEAQGLSVSELASGASVSADSVSVTSAGSSARLSSATSAVAQSSVAAVPGALNRS